MMKRLRTLLRDKLAGRRPTREALTDDYRRTFGSPHGERVLDDLMHSNFMIDSTIRIDERSRMDADQMLVNEGRRLVVMGIVARIEHDAVAERRPPETKRKVEDVEAD